MLNFTKHKTKRRNKMKKLLAFLLVAVMTFTMLVSCGGNGGDTTPPTAESLVAAADAALEGGTYKVDMAMSITTNNEQVNQEMDGIGTMMAITVTVAGNDFMMEMTEENESEVMALVGSVAYEYEIANGVADGVKCTLNEAQLNAFRGENNADITAELPIAPEDFATVTLTEADGKYTVVYADMKAEAAAELNEFIGMVMEFDTITVTMVIADGKYESFDISMSVVMPPEATGLTEEVVMTMAYEMDYSYANVAITLPENAASFEDVYYEDIAGNTSYYEYVEVDLGTYVAVETFVQGKQSWWFDSKANTGKGTIYTQDHNGGYFLYEVPLTEEEYNALEVGTHIMVYGFKSEWDGEVEIIDAEIRIIDDEKWIAPAEDVTALLGTEDIEYFRDRKVSFNGMTVEASNDEGAAFLYKWNGAGSEGDDIYFKASVNGKTYTFVIESYLTGDGTDVYEAAQALKVGDVIDMEAFLYWYDTDAQPHVYSITVK